MIAVETRPATVEYEDILEATIVEPDDSMTEAPWDWCDGWEHTATLARRFESAADTEEMQGCCWDSANRERVVITLDDNDYGIYQHQRERGASRQVALETVASEKRRTMKLLVNWYENGYEWWRVCSDFTLLGIRYVDSVGGIDDCDYAETLRDEIAMSVVKQIEDAGYHVTGVPEAQPACTRESKLETIRRRLQLQNWRD
ncbi:MAG: hypothetical protein WC369_07195 [Dehalococcoidales bacterium]|jgi:hypothetical protein